MRFFLFCAAAGSVLGLLLLLVGLAADGAPQQAALAGYALALAVLPYVFARACQMWSQEDRDKNRHDEVLLTLRKISER